MYKVVAAAAVSLLLTAPAAAGQFKVMIATWRGCEEACEGFQDYLTEKGIDADFILRDANQNKEILPGFLAEARAQQVDLILSWGTTVTRGIAGTLSEVGDPAFNHDIPQVFTIVADPVGANIVETLDDTGRPVTLVNAEGDLSTPSVVLIDGSDIIVGKEAIKAMSTETERIAICAKRDIGRRAYRQVVDGREYPPEVLASCVLKKLKEDAARRIGDFKHVVIT